MTITDKNGAMTVADDQRRQQDADRVLGYTSLPFETWEPRPPYFTALLVTDDALEVPGSADIHRVAKFFRQQGCDATLQYNNDGTAVLTVRRDEDLVVVISPHQYLVSDGRGVYRAVEIHEFRNAHRKAPANG